MHEIRVPATGNAGEDAVLLDWLVEPGAEVSEGDTIVTLETAKATHDVVATATGVLLARYSDQGDDAPEHALLAVIGAAGETPPDGAPLSRGTESAATLSAPVGAGAEATDAHAAPLDGSRISPRAAILAGRNGIDPALLTGSGPRGRIIVLDVIAAKQAASTATAPSPAAVHAAPSDSDASSYDSVRVSGARKVTAQRMHASLQNSAQVTLTRYADAGPLTAYLRRLREATPDLGLPRLSVNDLVLFATARAVARHPEANATFDWDEIRRYRRVDLGFAVDTGAALLVPVLQDAGSMSLADLARAGSAAIEKARAGTLTPEDVSGGTFTVSNLGGMGVHWFTPVLNPPQVCILGVGRALPSSPVGPDLMPLSLTFDHRALDGAAAAAVLADIAASIETVDVVAAL